MTMRTAIDTTVLLEFFAGDDKNGKRSREALRIAHSDGALIVSTLVIAELAAVFESEVALEVALAKIGVRHVPISFAAAALAGQRWRQKRSKGEPRPMVDLLLGAHALLEADRLLTRNAKVYGQYFPELKLLLPS